MTAIKYRLITSNVCLSKYLYNISKLLSFNYLQSTFQWWQVDKINPLKLYDDNKLIGGFQLRRLLFRQGQHEYVRQVVSKVLELYSQDKIKPTIDSVWAFEDVSTSVL